MNSRGRSRSRPARWYSSFGREPAPLRESLDVDTPFLDASKLPSERSMQASVYAPCPPLPSTLKGDVRVYFKRPLFDPDAPSKIAVIARTLRSIPVYKVTRIERFCDVLIFRVTVSLPPYGFQAEVLADSVTTGRQIAATALMLKFDPMADISALPPFVLNARAPLMTRKPTTNPQNVAENPQLLCDDGKPGKDFESSSEPPSLQPRNRSPRPIGPPRVSENRFPKTETRIFETFNKTGPSSRSSEPPLMFYEDRNPDPEMAEEVAQYNLEFPPQPSDVLQKYSPQKISSNSSPMSPTTAPHGMDYTPSTACTAPLQRQPIPPIATTNENREVADQQDTVRKAKRPLNSPRSDLSANRHLQTSKQKPCDQFRDMSLEESKPSQSIGNETRGVSGHDFELDDFSPRKVSGSSQSMGGNVNDDQKEKRSGKSNPKVVDCPFVKILPVSSTTPVQSPFRTMTGSTLLSRDSTTLCGDASKHFSRQIYKDSGAIQTNGNVTSPVPGSNIADDPSINNKKDETSWTDSGIAIDITNTPLKHRSEPSLSSQIPLFLRILGDYCDVDVRLQVTALVQAALPVRMDVRYFSLEEVPPFVKLGDNLRAKVTHVANGGQEELRSAMIFAIGSLSHTLRTERARHISLGYAASLAPRIVVLHNHPVFRTICKSELVNVQSPQSNVVDFVKTLL